MNSPVFSPESYDTVVRGECSASLDTFTRHMFRARRKYRWRPNWHHTKICDALMRVYRGECKRLIINIPPRYSKTEIAIVNFIAWCLGKHPDCEFIHVSYSSPLAQRNAYSAKMMVETPEYRKIFPSVQLSKDSTAKGDWKTTAGGVVYANSAAGPITGFGAGKDRDGFAGALLIDDPVKPDEAKSDVMRAKVNENYIETLQSRLNRPEETPVIVIMQRLHELDLSGFLLGGGSGEQWEHLCIPAIYQDDTGNDCALWPDKHSLEKLRQMEQANPYMFAGQYMQRPAPLEGGLLKNAWWQWWDGWLNRSSWPSYSRIVQSWDTAFKDKQQNDYSVCTTWLETVTGYYLIDMWKGKVQSPDLKRMAESLFEKYQPHAVLIEDKASGQGLIQELQRETRMPVIGIPKGRGEDKVALVNEVAPLVQSGRVHLPNGHPEMAGFLLSASQFPNAAHDDDVDSVVQALRWMAFGNNTLYRVGVSGT